MGRRKKVEINSVYSTRTDKLISEGIGPNDVYREIIIINVCW